MNTLPDLIHAVIENDTWSFCTSLLIAVFFSSFLCNFVRNWIREQKVKELERWVDE